MLRKSLLLLIVIYRRLVSPYKAKCCRFYPTCSQYALQAIEHYGAWHGGYLTLRRLLRCHPFNPGGFDPLV